MKKIIVFFISAMFAVNVCACAPVPKEVQEEMNSYNVENNKEVTVDSSFKYIDVSEIESNAKIALEKQDQDDFYKAKLATARFYFAKLLPETAGYIRQARAGVASLNEMQDDWF